MGGLLFVSDSDSLVVLDSGATASLAHFRWLENHNWPLGRRGYQKASTYPSSARFRFGDGCQGEVRRAADIPVAVVGRRGKFTAFVLGADIPALLREGALEAMGGQLDFPRDLLTLRKRGVGTPHENEPDAILYAVRGRFREGPIEQGGRPRGFGIVF